LEGEIKKKKSFLPTVKIPTLTEEAFQRCKAQLIERMEFVILGLKKCGLQAIPLTTPELIELFWAHHRKSFFHYRFSFYIFFNKLSVFRNLNF